ncbi:MAG TPA: hypothetical protein VKZ43_07680 [Trueperaceae bacterium]|nr:hypothetical protein [Trueperaceae bacterium]
MLEPKTQLAVHDTATGGAEALAYKSAPTSAPPPAFARDLAELDAIRQQCRALVTRSAGLSGVAAIVPIPAADIGVDVSLFLNLLPAINRRFGLSPDQINQLDPRVKELIFVSVTSIGSQAIGRVVTAELVMQLLRRVGIRITLKSAAKWVPIIGQAAAATISFGAMRMVGNRHVEDCYRVARSVLEAGRPTIDVKVVA